MKKYHTLLILTALTVIVCFSAIFLPERLAVRQDRELLKLSYSEGISDASVQLSFELTTAQRLNILSKINASPDTSYIVNLDLLPGTNEIQEDQCVQVCLDELNILAERLHTPLITDACILVDSSSQYCGILNWDNPQEKLCLWALNLTFHSQDEKGKSNTDSFTLSCLMDAENGTLYTINLSGICSPELVGDIDFPSVFAEYLGMELVSCETHPNSGSDNKMESFVTLFTLSQDGSTFDFALDKIFIESESPNLIYFYLSLR